MRLSLVALTASAVVAAPAGYVEFVASPIGKYPEYAGPIMVMGKAMAATAADPTQLEFKYDLTGLEADTTGGIHIHDGTSCATTADPGAHWFKAPAADDWLNVKWTSDASGNSKGKMDVTIGYTAAESEGKVVVVHAANGTKIGCAVLAKAAAGVKCTREDSKIIMKTSLCGDDAACQGSVMGSVSSDCLTCMQSAKGDDGVAKCAAQPASDDKCTIMDVKNFAALEACDTLACGDALLAKIALGCFVCSMSKAGQDQDTCMPKPDVQTGPFVKYPGYTGDLAVVGRAGVFAKQDTTFYFQWDLENLENNVTGGVHIHAGSNCDNVDGPGAHWFKPDLFDEWKNVTYTSEFGKAMGVHEVSVGYTAAEAAGKVVVVHAKSGEKIACAVLSGGGETTTASGGETTTASGGGDTTTASGNETTTASGNETTTTGPTTTEAIASSGSTVAASFALVAALALF